MSYADELPVESPTWDLAYSYSGGWRVLKTSKDALGVERHTLEVFGSLRFDRDAYDDVADDYERHRSSTHVYLAGGTGHVFYDDQLPSPPGTPPVRMFLNIGDHLGNASVTIDHTTSELVERATFQAYGAIATTARIAGAPRVSRTARWGVAQCAPES